MTYGGGQGYGGGEGGTGADDPSGGGGSGCGPGFEIDYSDCWYNAKLGQDQCACVSIDGSDYSDDDYQEVEEIVPDYAEDPHVYNDPIWNLPFLQGSEFDYGVEDFNNDGYIDWEDLEIGNQEAVLTGDQLQEQAEADAIDEADQAYLESQINQDVDLTDELTGGEGLGIDFDFDADFDSDEVSWGNILTGGGTQHEEEEEADEDEYVGNEEDPVAGCPPGWKMIGGECFEEGIEDEVVDTPEIACGAGQKWDPVTQQCIYDINDPVVDVPEIGGDKDDWRSRMIGGMGTPTGGSWWDKFLTDSSDLFGNNNNPYGRSSNQIKKWWQ